MWDNTPEIDNSDGIIVNLFTLLREVLQEMWRHALIILLVAALAGAGGFAVGKITYTPSYTASVLFTLDRASGLDYESGDMKNLITYKLATVFPAILSSDAVHNLVKDDLGYTDSDNFDVTLRASTASTDTNVVRLIARAGDPQLAYDALQSALRNCHFISDPTIGTVKITILSESGVPSGPSGSSPARKMGAAGVLLALLAAVVWLTAKCITAGTIRTEKDLEKALDCRIMGTVPKASKNKCILAGAGAGDPKMLVAVRTIRFRMEQEIEPKDRKTILITSALRSEGKTTLAANLALSLAAQKRKVLLIEGNLHSPALLPALGMPEAQKGLADVLAGTCKPEDVLISYKDNANLTILPAGKAQGSTAALWTGLAAKELFRNLKDQYDYILIDGTASASVADGALIAGFADDCIYVVEKNHADKEALRSGAEALKAAGCGIIGSVLVGN